MPGFETATTIALPLTVRAGEAACLWTELMPRRMRVIRKCMRNTQILSVRVPADLLERIDARCGGRRPRFIREALEKRLGRDAEILVPRTALGRKLAALRQRGLDSGARLLNLEEVNREGESRWMKLWWRWPTPEPVFTGFTPWTPSRSPSL